MQTPGAAAHATKLTRFSDRVLQRLTRRPAAAARAVLAIALGACVIGWLDHLTGNRVSFVIFYLGPVGVTVAWFGRRAGILAAVASVVIRFTADSYGDAGSMHETWLWWNSGSSLFVYLGFVWVFDSLVRLHRQLEQRVHERTEALENEQRRRQDIQRQLLDLSARERSAMGRELHDQLAQHLVGTAMAAQVLAQRLGARDEPAAKEARNIAQLVEQGIAETRQLARGLLLASVPPERLGSEIEELCANLRQQFPGVDCRCDIERPMPMPRDPGAAAQLFRIAQEALRNALRHSGANCVHLRLGGAAGALRLTIEDDGCGLPAPGARGNGMGLGIMQHRAEHIGASLEISARRGGGTVITCVLPAEGPAP